MSEQVFALKLAGSTRFIYWKPDETKNKHPHKIWNVNGTLEILYTHPHFDPDLIQDHICEYLSSSIEK